MKLAHLKPLVLISLLAIAQVGIAQGTDIMPNLQPSEQECWDSVQRAKAEPPEVVDTTRGDTFYKFQWYLHGTALYPIWIRNENTGRRQPGYSTTSSIHINVEKVWEKGHRGEGTYIAIVDSDIGLNNPELKPNLAIECSYDYNNRNQPYRHGHQVVGIAAARGYNGLGVRGVAPLAKFFTLSGGGRTTQDVLNRFVRNAKITAVSNHSYGSPSFSYRSPARFMAMETGLRKGFYGKGTVYVWAAGNKGYGSNTNYDTYVNHHSSVTVCGIDYQGKHNSGSTIGANLWVCAANRDASYRYQIFYLRLNKRYGDYIDKGTYYSNLGAGTSLSAPMVSGVVALMRQANPNLGWRDVKLILAASAAHNDPKDSDWQATGIKYGSFADDPNARYRFNHKYGFGLVDAYHAVSMAENWVNLPAQATAAEAQKQVNASGTQVESSLLVQSDMDFIEHVEPTINFGINRWRDLSIELISPAGTTSILAARTRSSNEGYNGAWRFGSSKHLGEAPSGTWRLIARNAVGGMITLRNWKLKIRGYQVQLGAVASDDLSDLNEDNQLSLSLSGAHWREALNPDDFKLSNAPPGLNIASVERTSSTVIKLKLELTDSLDKAYLFEVEATTGTVSNLSGSLVSNAVEIAHIALRKNAIPVAQAGSNYRYTASSDILSSPTTLTYTIVGLQDEMQNELQPDELGFSIAGATISGTPTLAGKYYLMIKATRDEDSISRTELFVLNVDRFIIETQIRVFPEGLLR